MGNGLNNIKIGDKVIRFIGNSIVGGQIRDIKVVTAVTEDRIICGDWEFDKETGAEIDDMLNWGPPPKVTGSYIVSTKALALSMWPNQKV